MSLWRKRSTNAPQEAVAVDAFTGSVDRWYSPHYSDEQGMRAYYPGIDSTWSWSEQVATGVIAEFVESRRLRPDWDAGSLDIRHPFIQFYVRPSAKMLVCGLSKLDDELPDDGSDWPVGSALGLVRGKIAIKKGDAVLDGGILTCTGHVVVAYTVWNGAFGVRNFDTVVIGALETEGSIEFS